MDRCRTRTPYNENYHHNQLANYSTKVWKGCKIETCPIHWFYFTYHNKVNTSISLAYFLGYLPGICRRSFTGYLHTILTDMCSWYVTCVSISSLQRSCYILSESLWCVFPKICWSKLLWNFNGVSEHYHGELMVSEESTAIHFIDIEIYWTGDKYSKCPLLVRYSY